MEMVIIVSASITMIIYLWRRVVRLENMLRYVTKDNNQRNKGLKAQISAVQTHINALAREAGYEFLVTKKESLND